MLREKLEQEYKEALKAKDEAKVSAIRMLKSEIQKAEIAKRPDELKEEDVLGVISKMAKQRKESIDQFKQGNRDDLVQKETKELEILQAYLPKQLSEVEITDLVKAAIAETGAQSKADMGKVMKALMPDVKGKADGKLVSQIVTNSLS